jgi:DNA-binding transcriptional LysR family regulator
MLLSEVSAFLEVARLGSMSRAAELLYVTQPTLTARIQNLETKLGERLFTRSRQGMRLTETGRAFLPYAERSVQALQEGQLLLADRRRGATGELLLGAAPSFGTYALPALLKRFAARHPTVRLVVKTGHSEEVQAMVLQREVQLGLMRHLRHVELEAIPVYEDELVLVVHPGHTFATVGRITLGEVGGESLILFDRSSSFHDLTSALFRGAGVAPRSLMELDSIEATKKMVEQGLGVALLPLMAVASELTTGQLRRIQITDAPRLRREIVAARRRDAGPAGGPVASFLSMLPDLPGLLQQVRSAGLGTTPAPEARHPAATA